MSLPTPLEQYYKRSQETLASNAKHYAEALAAQKTHKAISGLKLVSTATQGAQALDLYTTDTHSKAVRSGQIEVLARALATAIYDLQCHAAVLSTVAGAPFEPGMDDPSECTADTPGRIEQAIATTTRITRLVKSVTAAAAMAQKVNVTAKTAIMASMAASVDDVPTQGLLSTIDTNRSKEEASKFYTALASAYLVDDSTTEEN